MKKKFIYIAILLFAGIAFVACDDDDAEDLPSVPKIEEDMIIKSIVARISSFSPESRLGVFPDNPTASGFLARFELGHVMTVQLNGTPAEYTYAESRWHPKGDPLKFPEVSPEEGNHVKLTLKTADSNPQDGSKEGLLKADELVYEKQSQLPILHLTDVTMAHAKTLVELVFSVYEPESDVIINGVKAYALPATEPLVWRYQAIIEPGEDKFNYRLTFNDHQFDADINATDDVFEADKLYRIPIKLPKGGVELEIGQLEVVKWTEAGSGTAALSSQPNFHVTGYEGESLSVKYTNGDSGEVTLDGEGKGYILSQYPPRTIRSIQKEGHKEILIGRLEDERFSIVVDEEGKLQVRTREGVDYVIGTAGEWITFFSTASGGYNDIVLDADIDLMNETYSRASYFYATLDGQGHKVHNINIESTAGNIGAIGGYCYMGAVKNLHLASGKVSSTGSNIGGFFGMLYYYATVENCSSGIHVSGKDYVGGIAGTSNTNAYNINYCANYGQITASGNYAGGIVGQSLVNIIACANYGDVKGNTYVGGVAGNLYSKTMTASYNRGNIEARIASGNANAGGLTGNVRSGATIKSGYNTGMISVQEGVANAGAIAGTNSGNVSNTYWTGFSTAGTNISSGAAAAFSSSAWPVDNAGANWGIGSSATGGVYWKALYSWTGGGADQKYPELFWE